MKSNDWLTQQAEMLFADFIQDIAEKHPEATAKEKEKLLTERLLHAGWILGNIIDEVNKQASYADAHILMASHRSFPSVTPYSSNIPYVTNFYLETVSSKRP